MPSSFLCSLLPAWLLLVSSHVSAAATYGGPDVYQAFNPLSLTSGWRVLHPLGGAGYPSDLP